MEQPTIIPISHSDQICQRCHRRAALVSKTRFSLGKYICRTCEAYLMNIIADRNEVLEVFKAVEIIQQVYDSPKGPILLWNNVDATN